jgi:inhibitor of cysteine peptidase
MKHLARVTAALCLIALAMSSSPADAKSGKSLRVGNSWEFQFEGNPGTGYTWKLDNAASQGLSLIKLQSLGYVSDRKKHARIGAPAPFAFRVTCIKPGNANLRFAYIGPTGKRSPNRHEVWVRCD